MERYKSDMGYNLNDGKIERFADSFPGWDRFFRKFWQHFFDDETGKQFWKPFNTFTKA